MRGIAVCCGFNGYDFGPLDRAVNDAAILYARLTESGTFHGAPDLTGKGEVFTQPTSGRAVLAALTRAAMSTADLVWFSFSGHAVLSTSGELRLLLPGWRRDASEEVQRDCSIGAGEIEKVLRSRLATKKFVVILDTCHSGAFGNATTTRDVATVIEEQLAGTGAAVISSCSRSQVASDGDPVAGGVNGVFTAAIIEVLEAHLQRRTPLTVLDLFREAKAKVKNGQIPTLYVNGLTEDFAILGGDSPGPSDGIVPLSAEVPAMLQSELSAFLHSVVQIRRRQRVGLVHARRQLEGLAAEFYRYGDDAFVVPGHNANVAEAFDNARTSIVACTTPAYLDEWHRGGAGLLGANGRLIAKHGGSVIRFFFVRDDFADIIPGVLDVVRDHVVAGVFAVVVNVDSFGPAVLQDVFGDPRPSDLSPLECAFVDGKIFLRTHFVANGALKIELDQRPIRCHHEYRTHLRPFLSSEGVLLGTHLQDGGDGIVLDRLGIDDVSELRQQLDAELGGSAISAGLPITTGAARAPAAGWRAAGCRRPSRPGRG
jgi:hypothetical protein